MRLITYNILDGGEGRADPLAEVLEAQNPDVVALVEADVNPVVERIALRLGMDFIIAPGRGHSVALLSRLPIVRSINHARINQKLARCFLDVVVRDAGGMEMPIGVVHLTAGAGFSDEQKRLDDCSLILDLLAGYREENHPHLLCGDFNSNAPYQKIDVQHCRASTKKAWEENGQKLPRQVIQKIIDADYTDTYADLHNENLELIGTFDTQTPGQRVDYIFSFGMPTVKSSWIEQDRLAKYASDHFPIGVEI